MCKLSGNVGVLGVPSDPHEVQETSEKALGMKETLYVEIWPLAPVFCSYYQQFQ